MKAFILLLVLLGVCGALWYFPVYACEACGGDGVVPATVQTVSCRACGGKGTRKSAMQKKRIKSMGGQNRMCLTCKGTGSISQRVTEGGTCLICSGNGKRSLQSKIMQEAKK